MSIDCVAGYHLNPLTCGIAKFNFLLAEKAHLPLLSIFDPLLTNCAHPLISIKLSEFTVGDIQQLDEFLRSLDSGRQFSLFLHAYEGSEIEKRLVERASIIYCGNRELYVELRNVYKQVLVQEAWCPGGFLEAISFKSAEIEIFSFGMAHKLRSEYYKKLDQLLKDTGKTYALYLSTALHEGTNFEGSFATAYSEIKRWFSGPVYFLGYLSDSALFNKLSQSTFFVAFFEKGVRANNTSVHTAMRCGSVVITNLDQHSPKEFIHGKNVLDINQCKFLSTDSAFLAELRKNAKVIAGQYDWDALCALLNMQPSRTSNARAKQLQFVDAGPFSVCRNNA